jgi:hypothetical protein
MKYGMYLWFVIVALAILPAGCQSRNFMTNGKKAKGDDHGIPANSVDGYAKAHGISREEAAKRMRAEFVPPGDPNTEKFPVEMTSASSEHINK